jgi:hypothetical protein
MERITITEVYEDPMSGARIWEIDPEGADIIFDWLRSQGHEPEDVIREYADEYSVMADVPAGHVQFVTGGGYAIFDADLLGGNGDGRAERKFEKETGHYLFGA